MMQDLSIDKEFSVEWTHRFRCTRNSLQNDGVVSQIISEAEPPKILVTIDAGLFQVNNDFVSNIKTWIDNCNTVCNEALVVAGGEDAKNDDSVVALILEAINTHGMCRKSVVLAIGGGAMLDAVGFATSIAHRGLRFIRMPSTTLSACDSGVGVKNGINRFHKKNFIGVFSPPWAVINDYDLLDSLDDRHWRSGLSEVVKVALVKCPSFYEKVKTNAVALFNRDRDVMAEIVTDSATLHLKHITDSGDPFERREARPLDFGHWAAHKLEQITSHELTHGEAVAIGLAIDLQCSVLLGLLNQTVADEAIALLQQIGLPTRHPLMNDPELFDGLEEFREHLGGELTLLLLSDVGKPVEVHELPKSLIQQAIQKLG
jgi:3-dehydroquinate synthase